MLNNFTVSYRFIIYKIYNHNNDAAPCFIHSNAYQSPSKDRFIPYILTDMQYESPEGGHGEEKQIQCFSMQGKDLGEEGVRGRLHITQSLENRERLCPRKNTVES